MDRDQSRLTPDEMRDEIRSVSEDTADTPFAAPRGSQGAGNMITAATVEDDLRQARAFLDAAGEWLHEIVPPTPQVGHVQAAAQIGGGYVALAMLELHMAQPEPIELTDVELTDPFAQRALRAVEEARPHDGPHPNVALQQALDRANELSCRIDDAMAWIDEPDDASPEERLIKIRQALEGEAGRG